MITNYEQNRPIVLKAMSEGDYDPLHKLFWQIYQLKPDILTPQGLVDLMTEADAMVRFTEYESKYNLTWADLAILAEAQQPALFRRFCASPSEFIADDSPRTVDRVTRMKISAAIKNSVKAFQRTYRISGLITVTVNGFSYKTTPDTLNLLPDDIQTLKTEVLAVAKHFIDIAQDYQFNRVNYITDESSPSTHKKVLDCASNAVFANLIQSQQYLELWLTMGWRDAEKALAANEKTELFRINIG